jgi:hypothetical protein
MQEESAPCAKLVALQQLPITNVHGFLNIRDRAQRHKAWENIKVDDWSENVAFWGGHYAA